MIALVEVRKGQGVGGIWGRRVIGFRLWRVSLMIVRAPLGLFAFRYCRTIQASRGIPAELPCPKCGLLMKPVNRWMGISSNANLGDPRTPQVRYECPCCEMVLWKEERPDDDRAENYDQAVQKTRSPR